MYHMVNWRNRAERSTLTERERGKEREEREKEERESE